MANRLREPPSTNGFTERKKRRSRGDEQTSKLARTAPDHFRTGANFTRTPARDKR